MWNLYLYTIIFHESQHVMKIFHNILAFSLLLIMQTKINTAVWSNSSSSNTARTWSMKICSWKWHCRTKAHLSWMRTSSSSKNSNTWWQNFWRCWYEIRWGCCTYNIKIITRIYFSISRKKLINFKIFTWTEWWQRR